MKSKAYSAKSWDWIAKQVFPLRLEVGDRVSVEVKHWDGRTTRFEF